MLPVHDLFTILKECACCHQKIFNDVMQKIDYFSSYLILMHTSFFLIQVFLFGLHWPHRAGDFQWLDLSTRPPGLSGSTG